jgi:hypothetical protein
MPWGRYKGRQVKDLPTDYIVWLIVEARSVNDDIQEAAVRELEHRREQIDNPELLLRLDRALAKAAGDHPDLV